MKCPNVNLIKAKIKANLPYIDNTNLAIDFDNAIDYGKTATSNQKTGKECTDLNGKSVQPNGVDSHEPLIFTGSLESDLKDRTTELNDQGVAVNVGGSLHSVEKLQETNREEFFEPAVKRLNYILRLVAGTIEGKSGYGLNPDAEIKMPEINNQLIGFSPIAIPIIYLKADTLPAAYKSGKSAYIENVVEHTLAFFTNCILRDSINVFFEKDYIDLEDTETMVQAFKTFGFKDKDHDNPFNSLGSVQKTFHAQTNSVDHSEELNVDALKVLKTPRSIPVGLLDSPFFLSMPHTTTRQIFDQDLLFALAPHNNLSNSLGGHDNLFLTLADVKMKLLPEEAINIIPLNTTYTMELSSSLESLSKGRFTNFIVTKTVSDYTNMACGLGEKHIEQVKINEKTIHHECSQIFRL